MNLNRFLFFLPMLHILIVVRFIHRLLSAFFFSFSSYWDEIYMFVCRHGDFCGGNAIKICFRCSLVEIDWNSFVTFFMDFYIENKREELGCLMDVSSQQLLGTWTTCSSKKIQFFSSNFKAIILLQKNSQAKRCALYAEFKSHDAL